MQAGIVFLAVIACVLFIVETYKKASGLDSHAIMVRED